MASINALTIIIILVGTVLPTISLLLGVVALWYYGSEEDYGADPDDELHKNKLVDRILKILYYLKTATLPKIVFVIAFAMVVLSILMAPLDVANTRFRAGLDFPLGIIWQIFYGLVCIFVILIIPYMIFYYEAEDPDSTGIKGIFNQSKWAIIFTCCIGCCAVILIGGTYYPLGWVKIEYESHIQSTSANSTSEAITSLMDGTTDYVKDTNSFRLLMSFVVYLVSIISLFGYIIFLTCGGCGMTALPISCFKAFWNRPKRIKWQDFEQHKDKVKADAEALMQIGTELQNLQEEGNLGAKHIKLFQEFRSSVLDLESSWNTYYKAFRPAGSLGRGIAKGQAFATSCIFPCCQCCYGILAALISIIWLAHIIIYMAIEPVPHVGWSWGFLNIIFYYLDYITFQLPIPGVLLYAIFTIHLMICVINGVSFVASKIPLFAVHPLRRRDTMMSSLLFNVGLFLLASVTVNQFSLSAFSQYTAGTQMDVMFSTAMRNMEYVRYFFIAFVYVFFIFSFIGLITAICLFICGAKPKGSQKLKSAALKLGLKGLSDS